MRRVCYADIGLDLAKRRGDYRIRGNFLQEAAGPLENLDFERLMRLVIQSRIVGNTDNVYWKEMFRAIGQELFDELFRKNYFFNRDFNRAVTGLLSIEGVRFRFVVGTSAHPLAFEALVDDDAQHRILQSPVYRKIEGSSGVALLANESVTHDPSAWRCLIIVANVQGIVSGFEVGLSNYILEPLNHVDREGKRLEEFLVKNGICVQLLGGSSKTLASRKNLIDILKDGPWDMVHFAGHSYWDERESGKAAIFLRGENGQPQILSVEQLAVLLREAGTRFVYLSSCGSSGCGVELARNHIPAVVGYRWEVDDELAVEQAYLFYTNLFESRHSLEIAFLRTRQEMHDRHSDNRIWASSVLIRQSEIDWKAA